MRSPLSYCLYRCYCVSASVYIVTNLFRYWAKYLYWISIVLGWFVFIIMWEGKLCRNSLDKNQCSCLTSLFSVLLLFMLSTIGWCGFNGSVSWRKEKKKVTAKAGSCHVLLLKDFSECLEIWNLYFYPSILGIKYIAESTLATVMDGLARNIFLRIFTGHTWWSYTENCGNPSANVMTSILNHLRCWDLLLLKATNNYRNCFKLCLLSDSHNVSLLQKDFFKVVPLFLRCKDQCEVC